MRAADPEVVILFPEPEVVILVAELDFGKPATAIPRDADPEVVKPAGGNPATVERIAEIEVDGVILLLDDLNDPACESD